jgi:hypothetical protein
LIFIKHTFQEEVNIPGTGEKCAEPFSPVPVTGATFGKP